MSIRKKIALTGLYAACLAAIVPAAQAQQLRANTDPSNAEQKRLSEATAAVAANRAASIEYLANIWSSTFTHAEGRAQFRLALNAASNRTLAKIQTATTYEEVRHLLAGKAAKSLDGGALRLGDLSQDLVFTPINPPCRFVDTRFAGAGVPPANLEVRSYFVYGTGPTMASQGGNAAGCPSPGGRGDPVAISANFTAVSPTANGHLRVYPFGATLPTVSFLNYVAGGQNLANAGIVPTCFNCGGSGQDLSIYTAGSAHHIGDAMGYFYPVPADDTSLNEVRETASTAGGTTSSTLVADGILRFIGPTLQHTVTATNRVMLVANQAIGTTTSANTMDIFPCVRLASDPSTTAPTVLGGGIFGIAMTANTRIPVSVSASIGGLNGTYLYGMCYRTSSPNWNNNEWGYISTTVLNVVP